MEYKQCFLRTHKIYTNLDHHLINIFSCQQMENKAKKNKDFYDFYVELKIGHNHKNTFNMKLHENKKEIPFKSQLSIRP